MSIEKRNFWTLLFVSSLFGIAIGLYDFALPYFMKHRGISYQGMGFVFAISFLFVFFLQIWSARISDISGRKPFYSLSLFFSSIFNFLTPLSAKLSLLTLIKTLRETTAAIQGTINSVVLYENVSRRRYLYIIGRTSGLNFFFQGFGIFLAGILMLKGYSLPFFVSASVIFLAFVIFQLNFSEKKIEEEDEVRVIEGGVGFLNRDLWLLAISGFISTLGVAVSHTQMMPLFFSIKYNVSEAWVAILLALHRISLGFPMMFTGNWLKGKLLTGRNLKWLYVLFLAMEAIAISITAFIPTFLWAAGVWLIHDIIGGSMWSPIRSTLVLRFSRDETRAFQVATVGAISSMGSVFGPIIAGYLANIDISLPFSMSGVIAFLGIFPIMALKAE
jgi:DHA1 family multidrug resistance protein-like MFS transporter